MTRGAPPRVVLITRPTEYALLIARHATHAQAAFFLQSRGQHIEPLYERHQRFEAARAQVVQTIPSKWRRSILSRDDLDRFVFEPEDIVVALGQDGLVANTAKYLRGQTVIGINPDPAQYDGILVRHAPARALELMLAASEQQIEVEERAMVEARLDDGQRLLALNELFIGHRSHQSARYRIRFGEREERQSSSGVIVTTGTGATGWARSIQRERRDVLALPEATEPRLAFFVREAFPSISSGTGLTGGTLEPNTELAITSELNEGGLIFGDGLERDYLDFRWGMTAAISVSATTLRLTLDCA
jgi:NAD kinase